MNLNQVTLPTNNIKESVQFYLKMGFKQIVDSPHYARFECQDGGATFSLHLVDENPPGNLGIIVYFEHKQLDELVETLKSKNFVFEKEPTNKPWLWREAYLRDPYGNLICLYWAGENRKNPPWHLK